jgi:hypothetical protein
MRRPVSERDAVRSQVIDALEAQEIKETGNEEDYHCGDGEQQESAGQANDRFGSGRSLELVLRANGADIKVQQELLRHSNVQTTLQIYTQAVSEQKRAANAVVVGQLLVAQEAVSAQQTSRP